MVINRKMLTGTLIVSIVFSFLFIFPIGKMPGSENIADAAEVEEQEVTREIIVNGKGSVKTKPDTAYITIGVKTEKVNLQKAQRENSEKMNEVNSVLEKENISLENIKTLNYNVYPKKRWNKELNDNEIIGYSVTNLIEVKIEDIEKTGRIIDKVVSKGSNLINNIRFEVSDETKLYNEALKLAVKDANLKAEAMTEGLNIASIKPYKITENSYRVQPVYRDSMKTTGLSESSVDPTPINQGEQNITANVTVIFTFN